MKSIDKIVVSANHSRTGETVCIEAHRHHWGINTHFIMRLQEPRYIRDPRKAVAAAERLADSYRSGPWDEVLLSIGNSVQRAAEGTP